MNPRTFSESLALLTLLAAGNAGLTAGKLRAALPADLRKQPLGLPAALPRLAEAGLAEKLEPVVKKGRARWRLTPAGREALRAAIGELPARRKGWLAKPVRALAAAHAFGLEPRVATALGDEAEALPAFLLARRLGENFRLGDTAQVLARVAAARELGAANAQPKTLWRSLLQRAFATGGESRSEAAQASEVANVAAAEVHSREGRDASPNGSPPRDEAPSALASFAAEVHRAVRSAPADAWFGPRKVFIHRAWQLWKGATGAELDLPAFKQRLLAALRAGEIGLTRADFTATLQHADLAEAELRDGSETFHFITSQREEQP